ncbi:MAG: hypothetical protein WCL50_17375 [Spirochaetota bacterium]
MNASWRGEEKGQHRLTVAAAGEGRTLSRAAPVGYSGGVIHYVGEGGSEYFDQLPGLSMVNQIAWGQGQVNLVTGLGVDTVLPGVVILDCIVGLRGNLAQGDRFSLSYFVLPQLGFSNGISLGYGTGLSGGVKTYVEATCEILPNCSLFADVGLGLNLVPGGESRSFAAFLPLGFGMKYDFRRKLHR